MSATTSPGLARNSSPLVSVIIPTFGRPALLKQALESVASQRLRGTIEVVVVNDAGPSVASTIDEWRDALAIRLIALDQHVGPSVARNVGIEHANGKYLAFLDDDDLFLPGHLDAGCERLERNIADFVYMGAIVADRRLTSCPPDLDEFPRKAYAFDERVLLVANYLHTGSVIVRNFQGASVRFDESLDVCEDWDMWLALAVGLGYRVAFVNRITSIYHQIPSVAGLVAEGQLTSPTRFQLARDYINAKWPSDDSLVREYRDWMVALEHFRSDLIERERRMPNLLFDDILAYLHRRMSYAEPANYEDIQKFFIGVE